MNVFKSVREVFRQVLPITISIFLGGYFTFQHVYIRSLEDRMRLLEDNAADGIQQEAARMEQVVSGMNTVRDLFVLQQDEVSYIRDEIAWMQGKRDKSPDKERKENEDFILTSVLK